MAYMLSRRWLAGVVVGACNLVLSATAQAGAPAPNAAASAGHFVALCENRLQLAPAQATALHTYLDQEIDYLRVLALRPPAPETSDLLPTETQQLGQVMGRLLSPAQLRQYRQLQQTPQAQAYLRSMALLPDEPARLAKRQPQRRTAGMVAQRLGSED